MMLPTGPSTTLDLLFDSVGPDPATGLALDVAPFLAQALPATISSAVRRSVAGDVADAAAGLLQLDLTDILTAGWRKHTMLRAAGRRTREAPGTKETVVLAEHQISYEAHPYLDVLLGGAHLTRVSLTLLVTVDITGLAASVTAGRLTALISGRALVTASLDLAGAPVTRRTRELHLPLELELQDGLRLA